jgi:hypothetical protein
MRTLDERRPTRRACRAILLLLVGVAGCSGRTAGGGPGGLAGSGGSGAPASPGPWVVEEHGEVAPLVLAADGSHVIYGVRHEGSLSGSLRLLQAGDETAKEIHPAALVDLPRSFDPPSDRDLVLPAPDARSFLFRVLPQTLPDELPARPTAAVYAYDLHTGGAGRLVADARGPWAFAAGGVLVVDSSGDLLHLRLDGVGGPVVKGVRVNRGPGLSSTASLSPGTDAVAARGASGAVVVELPAGRTVDLAGIADGLPPVFSSDGARVAVTIGDALRVVDRASGARVAELAPFAALSPDLRQVVRIDFGTGRSGPAWLGSPGGELRMLGERAVSAGFTGNGRWVWWVDDLAQLTAVRTSDGAVAHGADACTGPEIEIDAADRVLVFQRCHPEGSALVLVELATGHETEWGPGRLVALDAHGSAALLLSYDAPAERLITWSPDGVADRGPAMEVALNADATRALVVMPGSGLRVIEPFGTGSWELDRATPTRWEIAGRRAAWTDGRRVVLADLP